MALHPVFRVSHKAEQCKAASIRRKESHIQAPDPIRSSSSIIHPAVCLPAPQGSKSPPEGLAALAGNGSGCHASCRRRHHSGPPCRSQAAPHWRPRRVLERPGSRRILPVPRDPENPKIVAEGSPLALPELQRCGWRSVSGLAASDGTARRPPSCQLEQLDRQQRPFVPGAPRSKQKGPFPPRTPPPCFS